MSNGPILIFDKSALQSLTADECAWLDNFFQTNITPLFVVEMLADLEKEVRKGRSPEEVVGALASKTPDMQSRPNVHHRSLLEAELIGGETFPMSGVPIIRGGKPVTLDGQMGIIFKQAPEEEALLRWHRREFLDVERQTAKKWRRDLSLIDLDEIYKTFRSLPQGTDRPKSLADTKTLADRLLEQPDREWSLRYGLRLLGVRSTAHEEIVARWRSAGEPSIKAFAPYFAYVCSVDLTFYIGIGADLIGRARPSNKVDIAYLYYLPFCSIFTSRDNLHRRLAPLFLRPDQSFVDGDDLKADLSRLDAHYDALPADVKRKGFYAFAASPPKDGGFLVTQLWEKHFPAFGEGRDLDALTPDERVKDKLTVEEINRFMREATPTEADVPWSDAGVIVLERKVRMKQGKWNRFPPEVKPISEESE